MYTHIYIINYYRFDQHAQIDLPAMLDYVLKVTGQKQLFYVGHSQGTIMGFAGFTFNQSLASRVKAFFALAPVAYIKHIKGAFKVVTDYKDEFTVCCITVSYHMIGYFKRAMARVYSNLLVVSVVLQEFL